MVPKKLEGKYKRNKIKRKSRRKEKMKENKKNEFKANTLLLDVGSNSFNLF